MSQPRGVRRAAKQGEAQGRIWDLGAGAGEGVTTGREYWKLNGEEWQKRVIGSVKEDQ